MPRVVRIEEVDSITVGRDSKVLPDHSIENPVPFKAVTYLFDDGVEVQIENPTKAKVKAAYDAKVAGRKEIGGVKEGEVI